MAKVDKHPPQIAEGRPVGEGWEQGQWWKPQAADFCLHTWGEMSAIRGVQSAMDGSITEDFQADAGTGSDGVQASDGGQG